MIEICWMIYRFQFFALLSLLAIGCVQSEYTKMVKSELAKGIRRDSILLGINFGDSQSIFREKCLELNKQHLTTQGEGINIQYLLIDSMSSNVPLTVKILFRPEFDEKETLAAVELKFSYLGWAPWNRNLYSDSLKRRVINWLTTWYKGNKFVTAHANKSDIPVKVDGNRRILVYEDQPQYVVVRVEDLTSPSYRKSVE